MTRTSRPAPTHRFIYVIGPAVGLQKVGIATDPRMRLATLQTACPFDLTLHVAIPIPFGEAHAIERRAHRALARSCVRNEWFEATPAEAINAVRAAVAPAIQPAQPTPAEWRISRAHRANPLIAETSDRRRAMPAAAGARPLPLFEFQQADRPSNIPRPESADRHPSLWQIWGHLRRSVGGRR